MLSDARALRPAVIGLLNFAAAEEQMLLAAAGTGGQQGSPEHWAAVPLSPAWVPSRTETCYLDAPGPARGMACYTLACSYAQAGRAGEALDTLAAAVALNPDLRANAARDADLRPLRDTGRLDALLG